MHNSVFMIAYQKLARKNGIEEDWGSHHQCILFHLMSTMNIIFLPVTEIQNYENFFLQFLFFILKDLRKLFVSRELNEQMELRPSVCTKIYMFIYEMSSALKFVTTKCRGVLNGSARHFRNILNVFRDTAELSWRIPCRT